MRFTCDAGKRPGEEIPFSIDFAKDIAKITGDAIATLSVTATKEDDGSDASSMIVDSSFVSTVCWATVQGGVAGANYLISFTAVTTSGKEYIHDIELPVRSDA